jgi:hypothetical protein
MDDWDMNMMEYWIVNRIYWNPNLKVERLRKYFIRRTFREAAPEMERFFGAIREQWYKSRHASGFVNGSNVLSQTVVVPKIEPLLRGYLEIAAEKAKHPISKILVHRVASRFDAWMKLAKKGKRSISKREEKQRKLFYGWIGKGHDASAKATTIIRNAKPMNVIKFEFRQNGKARSIITHRKPNVLSIYKTPVLSFSMIPSDETAGRNLPFPKVFLENEKGKGFAAPESAYSMDSNGSLSFKWDMSKTGSKLKKPRKIFFTYDYGKLKLGEKAIFYITKMTLR